MKVLLAGATGVLGTDILRELIKTEHEIVACCRNENNFPSDIDKNRISIVKADMTKAETLEGICDGVDVVISTVGLTKASAEFDNYDIDYQGNVNLLNEAKRANVEYFSYISVVGTDLPKEEIEKVAMVNSKAMFEKELMESGLNYTIHRPTGFFYDIAKVFKPMIEKGKVSLLKCKEEPRCNVVDTDDFAKFIVEKMTCEDAIYNVGGKETYTYREVAEMFFDAMGREPVIKTTPAFVMSILANLPKIKKEGKRDVILFGKYTMTHNCLGDTIVGEKSFKEYIKHKRFMQ